MFCVDLGSGPAVMLLHGTPSAPDDLGPLADALSRTRRVLVPHMPGYGQTPALHPFSLATVYAELESELRARGVERVALVGFSGGAYRALALALRKNVHATHVVSLGGLAGLDAPFAAAFHQLADVIRTGQDAELRASFVERMTVPGFAAREPALAASIHAWLDATTKATLADEMDAMAKGEDLRPRLPALDVPVLARVGALDAAVPRSMSEAIVLGTPRAVLQVVPGVGHALLAQDAPATLAAVLAFLT